MPLLSLILLMCVDLGRAVHARIVLTNSVRAGAEYGALHRFTDHTRPAWEGRIEQAVREELASVANASDGQLAIAVATTESGPDELQIEVSGSFPFSLIVAWPGFPAALQLTHSVTMRQYR